MLMGPRTATVAVEHGGAAYHERTAPAKHNSALAEQ